jgi:O-antigen/teichoic acid export membrane protein
VTRPFSPHRVTAGSRVTPRALWRTAVSVVRQSFVANAGYLMAVNITAPVLGFVFWQLVARLYRPAEVGTASAIWGAVMLVAGLAGLGIDNSILRFLPASEAPHRLLRTAFTLGIGAAFVLGAAYLAGLPLWSPSLLFLRQHPLVVLAFLVVAAMETARKVAKTTCVARRRSDYAFLHVTALNVGRLVFAAALAGLGTRGLVLSMAGANALALGIALFWFLRWVEPGFRLRPGWSWSDLGVMMPYAFANHIATLLAQASQTVMPIMTLEVLGPEASGHAYIAWQLGGALLSPILALSGSALVEASNAPEELPTYLAKATTMGAVLTLGPSLALALAAPWVLGLFGASYAAAATNLIRWMALATPFVVVAQLTDTYLRVKRSVVALAGLNILTAVTTLGGAALLMPLVGIEAWGIGWCVGNVIVAVVGIAVGRRIGLGPEIVRVTRRARALIERQGI